MHRVVIGAGTVCLICVAAITSMLVGGQFLPADQFSVFDALVDERYEIFLADHRTGHALPITTHFGNDRFPTLSPDGRQVAFISWRDKNNEIYVMNLPIDNDRFVGFSPDGRQVVFVSWQADNSEIYALNLVTRTVHNLSQHPAQDSLPAWSPDGTILAYTSYREGNFDVYLVDPVAGETFNLTQSPSHDGQPAQSVDSQQLVLFSDHDGVPTQFVLDLKQCAGIRVQRLSCWQVVQNIGNLEVVDQILSG